MKTQTTTKLLLSASAAALLMASAVQANNTREGDMEVTASVRGTCLLNNVGDMPFGILDYRADEGSAEASAVVQLRCVSGINYHLYADMGARGDRTLEGDGHTLAYELYTDSGYSTVLGTNATGNTISGTGAGMDAGAAVDRTIYGRILGADINTLANNLADEVSLSDTVVVTLEFN